MKTFAFSLVAIAFAPDPGLMPIMPYIKIGVKATRVYLPGTRRKLIIKE
jgi:hypothetical protein